MREPEQATRVVRFGVFEVDFHTTELRKQGVRIRLPGQSFQVLEALLLRPGDLVTREELKQKLWPSDTFGDFEHGLNAAVNRVREALGDSSDDPRFVETVPRRGYRFIAPVNGLSHSAVDGGLDNVVAIARPEPALESQKTATEPSPSKPRIWKLAAALTILLCIAVSGWIIERSLSRRRAPNPATSSNMRIIPLTDLPGRAYMPVLSPDAKLFAFFWQDDNQRKSDLYVQLVGGEKPLRLTQTSSESLCCAAWSPDGREISFGRCNENDGSVGAVFVVPALGGPERKLVDVACWSAAAGFANWTADGKSLVLADHCVPGGPIAIVVFSLETGVKRCLSAPPSNEFGDWNPILSPDQQTVAFMTRDQNAARSDIYTVPLAGGSPRQLTDENETAAGLMWSADGQYLSFASSRRGVGGVWRVPAAGGAIEPETTYGKLGSLSRDGKHLLYMDGSGSESTWRAELSSAGGRVLDLKPILSAAYEDENPQLSPDGHQIVFTSFRSAKGSEIWTSNADGGDQFRLTSFGRGFAGTPRWSPDGKWVAFDYQPDAHGQIYLVDAAGRNLRQITSGGYDNVVPSWSRDGAAIYFSSNRTGAQQIWRRELATGRDTQVTRHGGLGAFESFDAKTLYYSKGDGGGIWSIPVAGGQAVGDKEQHITAALHPSYWGDYAVIDSGLYLVDSEAKPRPTIMYYDFQTRRLTPVLIPKHNFPYWSPSFAASRDGRTMLFVQQEHRCTIIMVEYQ